MEDGSKFTKLLPRFGRYRIVFPHPAGTHLMRQFQGETADA
jgi:hypothetical protein